MAVMKKSPEKASATPKKNLSKVQKAKTKLASPAKKALEVKEVTPVKEVKPVEGAPEFVMVHGVKVESSRVEKLNKMMNILIKMKVVREEKNLFLKNFSRNIPQKSLVFRRFKHKKCFGCQQHGHMGVLCPQFWKEDTPKCFMCRSEEHLTPECPLKANIKCFNCMKTGHYSKECPKPKRGKKCSQCKKTGFRCHKYDTAKMCELCLNLGHFAWECKKPENKVLLQKSKKAQQKSKTPAKEEN